MHCISLTLILVSSAADGRILFSRCHASLAQLCDVMPSVYVSVQLMPQCTLAAIIYLLYVVMIICSQLT